MVECSCSLELENSHNYSLVENSHSWALECIHSSALENIRSWVEGNHRSGACTYCMMVDS